MLHTICTYVTMECAQTCTLEMQGLSSCQLAELARRQSKLVALKLQRDRSLWLGDAVMTTSYVSQLGDLHHISTFNRKEQVSKSKGDRDVEHLSVSRRVKSKNMQNQGGLKRGTSKVVLYNRTKGAPINPLPKI